MSIREVAGKAVTLAERLGADEAEAYVTDSIEKTVNFHEKIENGRASHLVGIGVRVVLGRRKGFFSISSIVSKDVENVVKNAIAIARASRPDPNWRNFPRKTGKRSVTGVYDKRTAESDMSDLMKKAIEIIDEIKGKDSRLNPTTSALGTSRTRTAISNSHGCDSTRRSTSASFFVQVKAEEAGKKSVSIEGRQARTWKELQFGEDVASATDRAIKMLDARRIPGKKTSIIFTNDLMSSILGVMFSRTVSAEAIQRGRSPWIGKVDHRVASDNFSLFDEGLRQGGLGTRAFDDEGVPQRTTRIIEKGILKSYLYDSYTASKDGVASTGNASRIASGSLGSTGPYAQIPTPTPNNLILKPGDASIDELIEDTREGLYVIECIGEWLSNPISGLLNATVTNAFEVRNGTISEPVKGVVVSGHFFDIMKNSISLIGDDVQNSGNVYAPSVRISEMTVAGE